MIRPCARSVPSAPRTMVCCCRSPRRCRLVRWHRTSRPAAGCCRHRRHTPARMPACAGCTDASDAAVAGPQRGRAAMNARESRRWQLLAIVVVIGYLIYLLAPVLMPFALAGMLAYLGDPLADRLEKLGLGRTLAVTIVFVVLVLLTVGALLLLIPLISHQVDNLIQNLPRYGEWI